MPAYPPPRLRARALLFVSMIFFAVPFEATAQSPTSPLPAVTIDAPRQRAAPQPRRVPRNATRASRVNRAVARPAAQMAGQGISPASLTVLSTQAAIREIQQTPGGVTLVPAEAYKNTTVANTIKDILDYVPGVFAQPKWGDDTRLSIRGSGLSRNFHLRGVQLYMDGIPINTADGYGDMFEIDPTAYKFVEVYKGGNALRFGANSLGGAINFVTPSGRDPGINVVSFDLGAFGFRRLQAATGGTNGAWDGFVTASTQAADGFRDHSEGYSTRVSGNIGYRVNEDVETRFYLNANEIRQHIPGTVTRTSALTQPEVAAAANIALDQQRNIDSVRFANKTTLRFDHTIVEIGAFGVERHLMHPIFQWLDYRYNDYGGFARATDDRVIGGFRNRLVVGVNVLNGTIDNQQFVNVAGQKGALASSSLDRSRNTSVYAENSLYMVPSIALIAGTQFLHATRNRQDRFLDDGNQSGATEFNLWSPKAGVLWQIDPTWQAFANVSRSAEVPSFGEGNQAIPFTQIRPQRATTYEIGTRGNRPDLRWEFALYRAEIKNELLCLSTGLGNCTVVNADRSVHQGIEAGAGAAVFKGLFTRGGAPDAVWINVAYTFNDFRYANDTTFGNNLLPGAPRHFVRAEMLYRHPVGFFFGPNLEWVPQAYFVDSANTVKTQAYALFGIKAGFDNGGPMSMYVEARNLANVKYIASASIIDRATATSALFEPGSGRAVYAGVKYRW